LKSDGPRAGASASHASGFGVPLRAPAGPLGELGFGGWPGLVVGVGLRRRGSVRDHDVDEEAGDVIEVAGDVLAFGAEQVDDS
jgi:hypothetical protein